MIDLPPFVFHSNTPPSECGDAAINRELVVSSPKDFEKGSYIRSSSNTYLSKLKLVWPEDKKDDDVCDS